VDSLVMDHVTTHPPYPATAGWLRVPWRIGFLRRCGGKAVDKCGTGACGADSCSCSYPLPEKNDQHVVVFTGPLTLTLSRREREQRAGIGERIERRGLSPRGGQVPLSRREGDGVRGL